MNLLYSNESYSMEAEVTGGCAIMIFAASSSKTPKGLVPCAVQQFESIEPPQTREITP